MNPVTSHCGLGSLGGLARPASVIASFAMAVFFLVQPVNVSAAPAFILGNSSPSISGPVIESTGREDARLFRVKGSDVCKSKCVNDHQDCKDDLKFTTRWIKAGTLKCDAKKRVCLSLC